jgi:hypothetical protein
MGSALVSPPLIIPWSLRYRRFDRKQILRSAHVPAAGAKGGNEAKHLGARAAVSTTKIQAKSDAPGDIVALDLTGSKASDARISMFCSPLD